LADGAQPDHEPVTLPPPHHDPLHVLERAVDDTHAIPDADVGDRLHCVPAAPRQCFREPANIVDFRVLDRDILAPSRTIVETPGVRSTVLTDSSGKRANT